MLEAKKLELLQIQFKRKTINFTITIDQKYIYIKIKELKKNPTKMCSY